MTVPDHHRRVIGRELLHDLSDLLDSPIERSMPALTLTRMPCAPAMLMSSAATVKTRRAPPPRVPGLAARRARSIIAMPVSAITRAHVGEVDIDEAGARDELGDALHALATPGSPP